MKKRNFLIAGLFVAGIMLYSCSNTSNSKDTNGDAPNSGLPSDLNILLSESTIGWQGEMINVKSHNGTVDLSEANLKVENGKIVGGTFVVDMTTMLATDENYKSDEGKTKLIGHLSSPDFFDVENYPTASFIISGSEQNVVKGNFTVRGITNEEHVNDLSITEKDGKYIIEGKVKFNRKDYEVSFDHPAKDMVLSDDILLDLRIVGSK